VLIKARAIKVTEDMTLKGCTTSEGTLDGSPGAISHVISYDPQPTTSTTLFGSTNIKGITVFSQQGVGNATTNLFNVPISTTQWDLAWSYDCPGASAGALGSNFVFEVFRDNTKDTKDGGAAGTAATGRGTEHYTDTGAFSIHVGAQSSCVWAFSAILPGS
jgi:hypothetical protein